jgi:hypothetical protein
MPIQSAEGCNLIHRHDESLKTDADQFTATSFANNVIPDLRKRYTDQQNISFNIQSTTSMISLLSRVELNAT